MDTDLKRFGVLIAGISEMISEIDDERRGLRRRYQKAADNAAFCEEVSEGPLAISMALKLEKLANTMGRYTARISFLQGQVDFLRGLQEHAREFINDNLPDRRSSAQPPKRA